MNKNRNLRRVVFGVFLSGWMWGASAGVQAEPPKIGGFVDTTYVYDTNQPQSQRTSLHSFSNKTDQFLLNAAQVNVEGAVQNVGYRAEFSFGTDASIYKSVGNGLDTTNPTVNFELQEAFLTYQCPVTSIQFKAGKFVTFEGIEVIESGDNPTITRGHLFGLAEPFTHVGALAGYAFPKVVDLWVGVANGWDLYTDNNKGKTLLAKIGLDFGEKVSGSLSMTHGSEQANTSDTRTSYDATFFVAPMEKMSLALQANLGQEENLNVADENGDSLPDGGTAHWYGIGIQPKVQVTDRFSVGSRYEWFSDLNGGRTGVPLIVQNISIAPAFQLAESLLFRVEYRYDWSTQLIYETRDGNFSKGETSILSTELIYKF